MKKTLLFVGLACAATLGATPTPASASCQSACIDDFPSACYNIKPAHWHKGADNIAQVRVRNRGSYGGAFRWAIDEINKPHDVGKRARLDLRIVSDGGDIKVWDDPNICDNDRLGGGSKPGYCGYWGLAQTFYSHGKISRATIWLARDEMNENTHTRDLLVRKQTMLHELLHTVGMNHACVNDNHTMWACGMPDVDYVHLPYMTRCDVDGLIDLYGKRP